MDNASTKLERPHAYLQQLCRQAKGSRTCWVSNDAACKERGLGLGLGLELSLGLSLHMLQGGDGLGFSQNATLVVLCVCRLALCAFSVCVGVSQIKA